jgi:hypothetical protein
MYDLDMAKEITLVKNKDNTYNLTAKFLVDKGGILNCIPIINCPNIIINNLDIVALATDIALDKYDKTNNINPRKMYKIKLEDYKIQVVCENCYNKGFIDSKCHKCGGKGIHNKTKQKWVVHKYLETIDRIDRDNNGNLRYWTDMSCFYSESNKIVHFTYKDALRECLRRNKKLL